MTSCVIFDIDGTLADASHRLHYVTAGNRDWDAFFAAMGKDTIVPAIRDLLWLLEDRSHIVLCTGRPDNYREVTKRWLSDNTVPYRELYMRAAGDHRADYVVKAEMLRAMRVDGYKPWLAVDDRPSIVKMWRENGITCLQCREWLDDRSNATKPGLLTLMIGPSGAGKTTWLDTSDARGLGIELNQVVSSDAIRRDLCGDFRDQTRNDEVFAALHAIVRTRVDHGLPTAVDATNLRRKDRMVVVALTPPLAPVRYVVIDRPEAEKRRDAGWRADLPFDLIARHEQTFRSQLAEILRGDDLPNVEVIDRRRS